MANKPGACDLRCNEAVLSAMLAHPRHGRRADFLAFGAAMVARGNWAFARFLPKPEARRALEAERERIAAKQSRSGLWFRKNAEEWSKPILAALDHAGLLSEWVAAGTLRRPPKIDAEDPAVILKRQSADGSWDGSVAATALEVERLLALGEAPDSPALARAGAWMLGQYRETHECSRAIFGRPLVVEGVLTAETGAEFRAAQGRFPHMKIAGGCFGNVPIIQTALALRALVALGLGNDPRVEKSYEGLLDLQLQPGEKPSGTNCRAGRFGNWCAQQICFKLEDRVRAERKKR